jgi:thiamine biosynthesis lipoprotein
MGLATSGDYRNFFEKDGKRYSHTIDSRTGYPVKHNLASVSVLHKSAAVADAWATALTVLGAERGLELAEVYNLAAYFIVRTESGYKQLRSRQFEQLRLD